MMTRISGPTKRALGGPFSAEVANTVIGEICSIQGFPVKALINNI